jgi:hypothetical protein
MSRAFVNEDSFIEELPDRPVSDHPNLVTERGLELIEAALEAARREYGEAQAIGDREALAKAGRELRYWSARRASANVVRAATETGTVQFGSAVTIVRDDGRSEKWIHFACFAAGAIAHQQTRRQHDKGRQRRSRNFGYQVARSPPSDEVRSSPRAGI